MPVFSAILMFSLQVAATATGTGPLQPPPAWLTRVDAFVAEQANVEHHVPVTAETIFQSGSVGKQFTAAAVMLMVEEGRLSLDDSITQHLPDAPQ